MKTTSSTFFENSERMPTESDGWTNLAVKTNCGLTEVLISPDGILKLVFEGPDTSHVSECVFAGDLICLTQLQSGSVVGKPFIIETEFISGSERDNSARRYRIGSPGSPDLEALMDEVSTTFGTSIADLINSIALKLHAFPREVNWTDVIPSHLIVEGFVNCEDVQISGRDYKVAKLGDTRLVLAQLPAEPPSGFMSLPGGLRLRHSDVWVKRFQRFIGIQICPKTVLKPIGFIKTDNAWFVASVFPSELVVEDIEDAFGGVSGTTRDVDTALGIANIVEFIHSNGITFSGFLNHHAFFLYDGDVYLNTAYLLCRTLSACQLYGNFSEDELPFLGPTDLFDSSYFMRAIYEIMNPGLSAMHPLKERDLVSLGLLLRCFALPPQRLRQLLNPQNHILWAFAVIGPGYRMTSAELCQIEGSETDEAPHISVAGLGQRLIDCRVSLPEVIELLCHHRESERTGHLKLVQNEVQSMWNFMSSSMRM